MPTRALGVGVATSVLLLKAHSHGVIFSECDCIFNQIAVLQCEQYH